jgi:hypothetical protein
MMNAVCVEEKVLYLLSVTVKETYLIVTESVTVVLVLMNVVYVMDQVFHLVLVIVMVTF